MYLIWRNALNFFLHVLTDVSCISLSRCGISSASTRVCRARRITRPVSFLAFVLGSFTCSNGKTQKNCLFEYKVTAVRLLITTCISAVDFAKYVEYKLHFLALLIRAVNHTTAMPIMQQCRRSCVSTVARCESAVDHVTALSIM
jgi:hypothetical protein